MQTVADELEIQRYEIAFAWVLYNHEINFIQHNYNLVSLIKYY